MNHFCYFVKGEVGPHISENTIVYRELQEVDAEAIVEKQTSVYPDMFSLQQLEKGAVFFPQTFFEQNFKLAQVLKDA